MENRPSVPQKIADGLMFANDHTCCICREKGKHIQTHHIDGNSSNNIPSNLAVLCLGCHSRVTGDEGLGRRYTQGEIVKYKKTWELLVRERLIGKRIPREKRRKGLSYFEITACEIVSMEDGDPRVREKLETMYHLNTTTGCTDEILGCLFYVVLMSSMKNKQTSCLLAKFIYQLFWHLVGPDAVSVGKQEIKRLENGIGLLGTIGEFNGEFSKDIEVIQAVCDNLYDMFEIAVWYDLEKIGVSVVNKLRKTKESCLLKFEDSEKPLNEGARYVDKTIARAQELMQKRSLKWNSLQIS